MTAALSSAPLRPAPLWLALRLMFSAAAGVYSACRLLRLSRRHLVALLGLASEVRVAGPRPRRAGDTTGEGGQGHGVGG